MQLGRQSIIFALQIAKTNGGYIPSRVLTGISSREAELFSGSRAVPQDESGGYLIRPVLLRASH